MVDELDTNMEFRIFDDRGKVDVYVNMDKILWEDDQFVLCESFDKRYCDEPILIRKSTREVMNTDFYSWLAETY